MRGPSSSHCAAALRIGRMARDLMDGRIEEVLIEFDSQGSLATTHTSQGSDMGLFGGLLGWDVIDERLAGSPDAIRAAGIQVNLEIKDLGACASQHLQADPVQCGRAAFVDRSLDRRRDDRNYKDRRLPGVDGGRLL